MDEVLRQHCSTCPHMNFTWGRRANSSLSLRKFSPAPQREKSIFSICLFSVYIYFTTEFLNTVWKSDSELIMNSRNYLLFVKLLSWKHFKEFLKHVHLSRRQWVYLLSRILKLLFIFYSTHKAWCCPCVKVCLCMIVCLASLPLLYVGFFLAHWLWSLQFSPITSQAIGQLSLKSWF